MSIISPYMDIGTINDGPQVYREIDTNKHTQVYVTTHDGEGNPLSAMPKSYISFSWGGKNIEDFGVLAVSDGDRYNGGIYGDFHDLTTNYDITDGQLYWGTAYNAKTIGFNLATDGMTEAQLQEFRNWFRPGVERELILAESPFRGIGARVSSVPQYSLLPFKETTYVNINNVNHSAITTLWKGTITLSFVMDEPFWHSNVSFFNETDVENLTSEELRCIIEDGIPNKAMLSSENVTIFLANNKVLVNGVYDTNTDGVNINAGEKYIYYCGTAKAKPIMSFTLTHGFTNNFVSYPASSYSLHLSGVANQIEETYDTIFIENQQGEIHYFRFSLPDVLISYNQAIQIMTTDFNDEDSIIELKTAFRDAISNFYVRKWAVGLCELALKDTNANICNASTSKINSGGLDKLKGCLRYMFNLFISNVNTQRFNTNYVINSETGEVKVNYDFFDLDMSGSFTLDGNEITPPIASEPIFIEENAGTMLRSEFLTLEDRTLPVNNVITKDNCLKIYSERVGISNFKIEYKYMYL